ncbi:MAG: hypothetical protein V1835_04595 [Candidatus Micrarchaeota archaeon]
MEKKEQKSLVDEVQQAAIAEPDASRQSPRKTNRPKRSLRLNFAYSNAALDVGLWESRTSEKGKLMPPSISLRLQDADPAVTRNAIYFKAADALKIANILQNFAFSAMEEDAEKRIEFARERKTVEAASQA